MDVFLSDRLNDGRHVIAAVEAVQRRQPDGKLASGSGAGTAGYHTAAVQLHEVSHQRESNTQASFGAVCIGAYLGKHLEDAGKRFRWNTDSRIRYADECILADTLDR